MRLALALMLWPGCVWAEAGFLGPLLDSLGNPQASGAELAAAMEHAGFTVKGIQLQGPDVLSDDLKDPYYFFFFAAVSPGPTLTPDGRPEMAVTCSRIGAPVRDAIANKTAQLATVQTWLSVDDFAPGAVAQLTCQVDLLPLEGAALPTIAEVQESIQSRFADTAMAIGTEPAQETTDGWVFYPPGQIASAAPFLVIGQTQLSGQNPEIVAPGKPDRIVYDLYDGFMHSFVLTGHIAPPGS